MNNISLTVPMDPSTLTQTATYLRLLASSLRTPKPIDDNSSESIEDITQAEINAGNIPAAPTNMLGVKDPVFAGPGASTTACDDQIAPAPAPDPTPAPAPAVAPAPAPAAAVTSAPAPAEPGVVLDKTGLPWDSRIHAATKTRVKKTDEWKKKRGVDSALVTQVEAELKATMSAPAAAVAPAPAPAAAVAPTPAPALAVASFVTIDPATITNFAEFMSACTSTGVAPDAIMAACQQHGVQAPTLLAARPDLVPAVAYTLFAPAA